MNNLGLSQEQEFYEYIQELAINLDGSLQETNSSYRVISPSIDFLSPHKHQEIQYLLLQEH